MSVAPTPADIFDAAAEEGQRRLDQSLLELVATSFIAGFTVVFGIAALGIVEGAMPSGAHDLGAVAGALAFGVGVVFLVVGRAELFTENFFDPTAAAVERDDGWALVGLARLWSVTFAGNLVGGALMVWIMSVEGVLPAGAVTALHEFALDAVARPAAAEFAAGVAGGALVALLSFFLVAVDGDGARLALAYVVGVMLALGPFDHVVVTVLHVLFGLAFGTGIDPRTVVALTATVTAGNVVGGIGLVTLTHVAQALGGEE